jgi:hypothetical protein
VATGNVGKKVVVVDTGCRWAKVAVADNMGEAVAVAGIAWEVVAVAGNAWEVIAVADNGEEVAVPNFVKDNLVPRTGFAGYDEVVVIPSGYAGHIGTHAAEVDGQAVEYVVL